jgi:hypothetical protein
MVGSSAARDDEQNAIVERRRFMFGSEYLVLILKD